MSDSTQARNLWRVRRTLEKMLTKRGYVTPTAANGELFNNLTLEQFAQLYGTEVNKAQLTFLARRADDESDFIWVFFAEEAKVSVKAVRLFVDHMSKHSGQGGGARHAIIVADQTISPFARNAMAELSPDYVFEEFTVAQLLVDITEHELVPQHVVLTAEEKKQLLKRYNLNETQLPRMVLSDPIARYFGLTRGQVVKICRASETAGQYVSYRIVL